MKNRIFRSIVASVLVVFSLLCLFSCDQLQDVVDGNEDGVSAYDLYTVAKTRFATEIATGDDFSIEIDYKVDDAHEKIKLNCKGTDFSIEIRDEKAKSDVYRCAYINNTVQYAGTDGRVYSLPLDRNAAITLLENTPAFKKYVAILAFNLPAEWFTTKVKPNKDKEFELDMELTEALCRYLPEDVEIFTEGSKLKFLYDKDKYIKKLELKKVYINDVRCDVMVKFDWDHAAPVTALK